MNLTPTPKERAICPKCGTSYESPMICLPAKELWCFRCSAWVNLAATPPQPPNSDQNDERIAEQELLERYLRLRDDPKTRAHVVNNAHAELIQGVRRLTARNAALERERDNEKQSANAISAQADRLAKQRDELKRRVAALELKVSDYDFDRRHLKTERDELKKRVGELEKKLADDSLWRLAMEYKAENAALRASLDAERAKLEKAKTDAGFREWEQMMIESLATVKDERDAAIAALDEAKKEREELINREGRTHFSTIEFAYLCRVWDRVIDRLPGLSRVVSLGALDELAEHLGIKPRDSYSDEYIVIKATERDELSTALDAERARVRHIKLHVEEIRGSTIGKAKIVAHILELCDATPQPVNDALAQGKEGK